MGQERGNAVHRGFVARLMYSAIAEIGMHAFPTPKEDQSQLHGQEVEKEKAPG